MTLLIHHCRPWTRGQNSERRLTLPRVLFDPNPKNRAYGASYSASMMSWTMCPSSDAYNIANLDGVNRAGRTGLIGSTQNWSYFGWLAKDDVNAGGTHPWAGHRCLFFLIADLELRMEMGHPCRTEPPRYSGTLAPSNNWQHYVPIAYASMTRLCKENWAYSYRVICQSILGLEIFLPQPTQCAKKLSEHSTVCPFHKTMCCVTWLVPPCGFAILVPTSEVWKVVLPHLTP